MTTIRFRSAIALVLLLLLGLGTMAVLAAPLTGSDPASATFIDNQVHTLARHSDVWFKFAYNDADIRPRPTVFITLVNGTASGVRFEVWSFEDIAEWTTRQPVGRGTAASMNCDTGQIIGSGTCKVKDLSWVGGFGLVGTYYVRVINDNDSATNFLLTIQGDAVRLGPLPKTPSAPPVYFYTPIVPVVPVLTPVPGVPPVLVYPTVGPVLTPPAVLTPFTGNLVNAVDDPSKAVEIDNLPHLLPPNSATWYRFNYTGTAGLPNPIYFLRLVNGVTTGVGFEVWAPQDIDQRQQKSPIARGTPEVLTNCYSGAQLIPTPVPGMTPVPSATPAGTCTTTDLTWASALGTPGTYFVRVTNATQAPANYQLMLLIPAAPIPAPGAVFPYTQGQVPPPVVVPPNVVPVPPALIAAVDDPNRAVPIDDQPHTMPAHSATWYKFDYGGSNTNPKPVFFLRLVNGVITGVRFEVWDGQNLHDWWLNKPVGRGTQEVLTNCNAPGELVAVPGETPEPTATPTGKCFTNDLTWAGAFGASGTYYVRVVNESDSPMPFTLRLN